MNKIKYSFFLMTALFVLAGFLRFYKIDSIPPGLYIDEVSIGYNAYTILKTGKDEYGEKYPLWFKSFGDYKMPVYIYATAVSMYLFGKNEFAVRFPSALFGTLTIIVFYFFFKKLLFLDNNRFFNENANVLAFIGTFFLTISPWHIQFSRAGFEITVAVFFYLLGCFLFLLFWEKKKIKLLLFTYLFFAVASYTYHTFRILSPITFFITTIVIFPSIKNKKQIIPPIFVFLLLFLPIFLFSLTANGESRFSGTSAFSEYPTQNSTDEMVTYPMVFLKDYLSFFSFDYLFSFGDGIGRHQIPGFGLFYLWQMPFLLAGCYFLLKQKDSFAKKIIFGLMIIAPIAPAIARPSPHSLRILFLVIPLIMMLTIGVEFILKRIIKKRFIMGLLILMVVFQFVYYLHFYYVHYPKTNIIDWGGGYKEIVLKVAKLQHKYPHIVVDANLGFAASYFHFYNSNIVPIYVDTTWRKPTAWKNEPVLYIRPYYGQTKPPNIIDTVYIPNVNNDIFAQFFAI